MNVRRAHSLSLFIITVLLNFAVLPFTGSALDAQTALPPSSTVNQPAADPFSATEEMPSNALQDFFSDTPLSPAAASSVTSASTTQVNEQGAVVRFEEKTFDENGDLIQTWLDEFSYAADGVTLLGHIQTKTEKDAVTKIYYTADVKTYDVRTEYDAGRVTKVAISNFNSQGSLVRFEAKTYDAAGNLVETWGDDFSYADDGVTLKGHIQTKLEDKVVTKIYYTGTIKTHDTRTQYHWAGGPISRVATAYYNNQGSVTYFVDSYYLATGANSYTWYDQSFYAEDGKTKLTGKQTSINWGYSTTINDIIYYANGLTYYSKSTTYLATGALYKISQSYNDNAGRLVSFNELTYDAYGRVANNWTETRSYYGDGKVYTIYKVQYKYGAIDFDLYYVYYLNGSTSYYQERGWHSNGALYNQISAYYNTAAQVTHYESNYWDAAGKWISGYIDQRSYYSVGGALYSWYRRSYSNGVLSWLSSIVLYANGNYYYYLENKYHPNGVTASSVQYYFNYYGVLTYYSVGYWGRHGRNISWASAFL